MNCKIIHSSINFSKILTMCTVLNHQVLDSQHLQWPLHRRGNPPLRTQWNAQNIMLGVEPALWSSVTGHVKDTKVLFRVLSADPKLLSTVNAKHSHYHLCRRWLNHPLYKVVQSSSNKAMPGCSVSLFFSFSCKQYGWTKLLRFRVYIDSHYFLGA